LRTIRKFNGDLRKPDFDPRKKEDSMAQYATKQRGALLAFLSDHADTPLTAKAIAEALSPEGVSLSAVYRNLAELEKEGRLQRITKDGSRQVYYRFTDAEGCRSHLHLSCFKCGKTFHMEAPVTEELLHTVAQGAHFDVDSSATILYGICEACQKQPGGKT